MQSAGRLSLAVLGGALLSFSLLVGACSGESSSSCTCDVEVNGDKRAMTCGESACVGGASFVCGESGATRQGDACASTTSGGTTSGGTTSGGTPVDDCKELETYCHTKCTKHATVHESCLEAAASGDERKCVSWRSVNASLCTQ